MQKDKLIDEALKNIRKDRKRTEALLVELQGEINSGETSHASAGGIAAKYVETLQRSNEQLVKVSTIIHKRESAVGNQGLSDRDKDDLFDIIKDSE